MLVRLALIWLSCTNLSALTIPCIHGGEREREGEIQRHNDSYYKLDFHSIRPNKLDQIRKYNDVKKEYSNSSCTTFIATTVALIFNSKREGDKYAIRFS